jgi:hypothetical protein
MACVEWSGNHDLVDHAHRSTVHTVCDPSLISYSTMARSHGASVLWFHLHGSRCEFHGHTKFHGACWIVDWLLALSTLANSFFFFFLAMSLF